MGKWATYQKRGGSNVFGNVLQPLGAPTDWTAVTGGVGVITVTRLAGIPGGATQMLWRAIDTTTNIVALNGNATLTGLVSGRAYRVQASWWNGTVLVSDWSLPTTVNAG